ncbi:alpha/beta hydrolase fold domain-containing protein [Streptomyces sp. ISL-12]|uniref:alpha/beta hydrolase fold domain-containing protein n=1 Tax=Streptomyces sp. ISL-12 TaxID=2819177 RepID=UPI001BECB4B9|nr:alpha/beta hydrolase fold domain-containing protein [Streptomyces sp. ISL-12]MBT2415145.1 alpha/beta hydrolase fold domain-containing protein [Streptomyces sp. ISL-12]
MTSSDGFVPNPDAAELAAVNRRIATMMRYPDLTTPEGLAAVRATDFSPGGDLSHPVSERTVPGPGGELTLRIIRPEGPPEAVMIGIHGGGWCTGTPAEDDWLNDYYAGHSHVATVAIDYRLAPEHPMPAAVDDCLTGVLWVAEHAAAAFGTERLLLHGASAGAHLAAATLLRLRDEHPRVAARIAAAGLLYGAYDLSGTPSQRLADDHTLVLPAHWIRGFAANTFPDLDAERLRDPALSPLYAQLDGLPPALFTVGALDPLLDDSLFMAARWRAAGNHADLDVWPGGVHGFDTMGPRTGRAVAARVSSWFSARLAA